MKHHPEHIADVCIKKVIDAEIIEAEDVVAVEEPLEISVEYFSDGEMISKAISVTMRTPGNDEDLAAGFCFTEGIIQSADDAFSLHRPRFDENKMIVQFREGGIPALHNTERNFYTTSSCGVCGKSSIEAIFTKTQFSNVNEIAFQVTDDVLKRLPSILPAHQQTFRRTGGLHAATLFDRGGNILSLKEDVGRHNALDKLIGAALIEKKLPLRTGILLLSGRASFELVQKAIMAGIKIVAAIGAPSSLAIQTARDAGMTLIGFLKEDRFNIYCGSERITVNFTDETPD